MAEWGQFANKQKEKRGKGRSGSRTDKNGVGSEIRLEKMNSNVSGMVACSRNTHGLAEKSKYFSTVNLSQLKISYLLLLFILKALSQLLL